MHRLVRRYTTALGWHLPLPRRLTHRYPIILAYHGIPRRDAPITSEVFERHVRFLVRHFDLVAPTSLGERRKPSSRITVLLTFDDGFRNHAEVVAPILTRYRVPAIFFIPSRHMQAGRYLWFSYLQMLNRSFRGNGFLLGGEFMDMSENSRSETVKRLRRWLLELTPHPSAMYKAIEEELPRIEDFLSQQELRDHVAGMMPEQVTELAQNDLFTVGVHTVDHPFLTRCDRQEAARQIQENRRRLEELTSHGCDLIAYPGSDFNAPLLQQCCELGFVWGFSEERRVEAEARLQLPRVGVYFPPVTELGCKVRWGNLITTLKQRPVARIASLRTSPAATTHNLA